MPQPHNRLRPEDRPHDAGAPNERAGSARVHIGGMEGAVSLPPPFSGRPPSLRRLGVLRAACTAEEDSLQRSERMNDSKFLCREQPTQLPCESELAPRRSATRHESYVIPQLFLGNLARQGVRAATSKQLDVSWPARTRAPRTLRLPAFDRTIRATPAAKATASVPQEAAWIQGPGC